MQPSMRETMRFHVNAPVDRVFDLVADFEATFPVISRRTRITDVSPGPVGLGTVVHYVNDRFGIVGQTEVVQYAPPHTLGLLTVANGGRPFTTVTVIEAAEAGGSTVRIYSNGKPYMLSRWLQPFTWMFAPIVRKVTAKANDRYVRFARERLET